MERKGYLKKLVVKQELFVDSIGRLGANVSGYEYVHAFETELQYDCRYLVRSDLGTLETGRCNYDIDSMTNLTKRAERLYGENGNHILIIDDDGDFLHEIEL